jgi:hypothetical protein
MFAVAVIAFVVVAIKEDINYITWYDLRLGL